jgi:hypothetical protein
VTEIHHPNPAAYNAPAPPPPPAGPPPDAGPGMVSRLTNNPMLTFVPWIIFWVVSGPRDWELGTGCALLASVVLLLVGLDPAPLVNRAVQRSVGVGDGSPRPRVRLKAPKILDLGTCAFFLVLVIIGAFADRHTLIGLERYSQAISSGALGLIVILSIAVGHPFTEQYARDSAPPEVWHTPVFRRMMLVMSSVWAVVFVVMAVLGLIAETGVSGAGTSDVLNWYIPIGLIVVGLKFNEWYPNQVMRHFEPA